jgi:hypothetical protein
MGKPKALYENRPGNMDSILHGKWRCCIGWDHIAVLSAEHMRVVISSAACKAPRLGQRIELLQGERTANSEKRGGRLQPPPCR